jgi:hypothetical protein
MSDQPLGSCFTTSVFTTEPAQAKAPEKAPNPPAVTEPEAPEVQEVQEPVEDKK